MAGWRVLGVLLAAAFVVLLAAQAEAKIPAFTCDEAVSKQCQEHCVEEFHCDKGEVFNKTCFWWSVDSATWNDAQHFCKIMDNGNGWQLAKLHSKEEQNFLGEMIRPFPVVWIGLSRPAGGEFTWSDGTPLDYTGWKIGHPSGRETEKHCVHTDGYGFGSGIDCNFPWPYACSRPAYPLSCKEGMSKTCSEHCKPLCRADEHQFGEDTCFHVTPDIYNWEEAQEKCRERDMELASISSEEEMKFLVDIADYHDAWIGLELVFVEGQPIAWQWTDGTPYNEYLAEINDWATRLTGENCVYSHRAKGLWRDSDCKYHKKAACMRMTHCGDGEHRYGRKTCFWFDTDKITHDEADKKCKNRGKGWKLASLRSTQEKKFVLDVLRVAENKPRTIWLPKSHNFYYGDCDAMNVKDGEQHFHDCADLYGFVCRRGQE